MDSPKWYFLHSYSLCTETCKNSRELLAKLNGAKFGGEMFHVQENALVKFQPKLNNIKYTCFTS